jgi:hypothetical protein
MRCGVDCVQARILMMFDRPGGPSEMLPDDASSLAVHLSQCPNCAAAMASERAFDCAVRPAMQAVAVPSQLRAELLRHATVVSARTVRHLWLRRATSTAAIVVAGVFGWGVYVAATRPALDTWSLAAGAEAELERPEAAAREWFGREQIPAPLPEDFDWRFFARAGTTELQGVPVASLELRNTAGVATLYFVRPGQFSTRNLQPAQNSTITVRIYANQPAEGWTLVIVHSGASLNPFLKPAQPPI